MVTQQRVIIFLCMMFASILVMNHMISKKFDAMDMEEKNLINQQANERLDKIKKLADTPKPQSDPNRPFHHKPANPADYGIITVSEYNAPRTQLEWDVQIERIFKQAKLFESEDGKVAVEKMKMKKEEFDGKMSRVNDDITEFEEELRKNPLDKRVQKRLQTLYKLKAVGRTLEGKVTSGSPQAQMVLDQLK